MRIHLTDVRFIKKFLTILKVQTYNLRDVQHNSICWWINHPAFGALHMVLYTAQCLQYYKMCIEWWMIWLVLSVWLKFILIMYVYKNNGCLKEDFGNYIIIKLWFHRIIYNIFLFQFHRPGNKTVDNKLSASGSTTCIFFVQKHQKSIDTMIIEIYFPIISTIHIYDSERYQSMPVLSRDENRLAMQPNVRFDTA